MSSFLQTQSVQQDQCHISNHCTARKLSFLLVLLRCDFFQGRSVSNVDQCFHEKVSDWFGYGVYACAPSTVWIA